MRTPLILIVALMLLGACRTQGEIGLRDMGEPAWEVEDHDEVEAELPVEDGDEPEVETEDGTAAPTSRLELKGLRGARSRQI